MGGKRAREKNLQRRSFADLHTGTRPLEILLGSTVKGKTPEPPLRTFKTISPTEEQYLYSIKNDRQIQDSKASSWLSFSRVHVGIFHFVTPGNPDTYLNNVHPSLSFLKKINEEYIPQYDAKGESNNKFCWQRSTKSGYCAYMRLMYRERVLRASSCLRVMRKQQATMHRRTSGVQSGIYHFSSAF